ncbi:hypothetical protein D3C77_640050 [compost metagenome]
MGQGSLNGVEIESPVLGEFLIFGGDHGDFQRVRQFRPGPPVALQLGSLPFQPGAKGLLDHQGGAGGR